MLSSAFSDRIRIASIIAIALITAIPINEATCQLTSSKIVTIMPFVSSEADSALAATCNAAFLLGIRQQNTGMVVFETERALELSRAELKLIVRDVPSMGKYATNTSSAFLVCGAIRTLQSGEVEFSLACYGTDDRGILFTDLHIYESKEAAVAGMADIASEDTHSSKFTPFDTPIMYSMIVPGAGQLSMGETAHAVASVGLILAAVTLSPLGEPEEPAWRKKQLRQNKTFFIALAWAINVMDTFALCRHKMGELDTRPFFSIVETANGSQGTVLRPVVGITFRW